MLLLTFNSIIGLLLHANTALHSGGLLTLNLQAATQQSESANAEIEARHANKVELNDVEEAARFAAARVVKITGAAVGSQKGYGSGTIVSADGLIVTALTTMIEAQDLRVVLDDGRKFSASLVARDDYRQLAVLRIAAADLPHFDLKVTPQLAPGAWVLSASNVFKVAQGPEPVSITLGTYAGTARLAARYRRRDVPFRGAVVLTDIITSAPGSAGGAIVDLQGRLVGVIGRPATSLRTNTWLNYALPVAEVRSLIEDGPRELPLQDAVANDRELEQAALQFGVRLWDIGGSVRPAYVERVVADSRAYRAGLQPDDLILEIDQQPIANCEDAYRVLTSIAADTPFEFVVKRGGRIETVTMTPTEGSAQ